MSDKRLTPSMGPPSQQEDELRLQWEEELGIQAKALDPPAQAMDFDNLFASIEEQVEQEALHSRPWSEWKPLTRIFTVSILSLMMCALLLLVAPRADLTFYPMTQLVAILAAMTLMLVAIAWMIFRPLYKPPLPVWLTHYVMPLVGLAMPAALGLMAPDTSHSLGMVLTQKQLAGKTAFCLVMGMIMALPFLFLAYKLSRHQSPVSFIALAAAAGGLSGNLTVTVICPINTMAHLVFGHGTIGLGLLALLFLLSKRFQRPQTA